MTRPLVELVEQFCQYQLKQRGKTEGGVQTVRWSLEQFLLFVCDVAIFLIMRFTGCGELPWRHSGRGTWMGSGAYDAFA